MCVFLISPVPIAEPLTSELIDTPVFYNLAPRPIKYRVSVPIPTCAIHLICQPATDIWGSREIISELKSQLDDLCEQDIVRISEKGILKMFMYLIFTV